MKTKKPSMDGVDDFISSGKADQHTSLTAKHTTGMPVTQQIKSKKITYYIKKPELIKQLKQIGLDTDRDLSDLTSEAIEDLVHKYASKPT